MPANSKIKTALIYFLLSSLLVFSELILLSGCSTSTSSDNTDDGTNGDQPMGNIFIFTDTHKIYQYNIAGNRFTVLNEEPYQPFDFAVSANGSYLSATFPDSILGLYSVAGQKWKYFNTDALLKGPVSSNIDGSIIAYTIIAGKQRRINLLDPQNGSIYGLDLGNGAWADYPFFEKSAGNGLAYTQDIGFFIIRIPNGSSVKL